MTGKGIASSLRPVNVVAFVDWNSQIHAARAKRIGDDIAVAKHTLNYVGKVVTNALVSENSSLRYDVSLRLYHGWRKGFQESDRRIAVVSATAATDFASLSHKTNVVVRSEVGFGDNLMSAVAKRLHNKISCHLPNTLRQAINDKTRLEEKMVDTAIASDVVDMAHREMGKWIVIVGDDDDLVPALYVAEGAMLRSGGRIILIRTRPDTPFLNLDDIRYRP